MNPNLISSVDMLQCFVTGNKCAAIMTERVTLVLNATEHSEFRLSALSNVKGNQLWIVNIMCLSLFDI